MSIFIREIPFLCTINCQVLLLGLYYLYKMNWMTSYHFIQLGDRLCSISFEYFFEDFKEFFSKEMYGLNFILEIFH